MKLAVKIPAPKPSPAQARPTRSPKQLFKIRDQNSDGFLLLEEYIGDPPNRNVPAITKRFQCFDTNQDGKLTLEELKKAGQ